MKHWISGLLTAALAVPQTGAVFAAQEQPQPLVFGTQVELVAIPVFVKDKKGSSTCRFRASAGSCVRGARRPSSWPNT